MGIVAYFSDGRCTPNGSSAFYYEYSVKDHLGNARVSFRANGASLTGNVSKSVSGQGLHRVVKERF